MAVGGMEGRSDSAHLFPAHDEQSMLNVKAGPNKRMSLGASQNGNTPTNYGGQ